VVRVRKILLVLISLLILTGCTGVPSYQVNERAYVQIFGVNKVNETYGVFIQLIADGETAVVSGEGDTVNAAIANAELRAGKKLFLGHMKLFILGDGIDNISKELEVFLSGDICPACPVVYAERPGDIVTLGEDEGGYSADELLKIITVYAEQGKSIITPLTAVATGTAEGYTAAPIPIVSTNYSLTLAETSTVSDESKPATLPAGASPLIVGGVTFVGRDGVSGFVPQADVYGLQLLTDNLQRGEKVTVVTQFDGKTAAADILGAKVKKTATREGDTVRLDIEITLKTDITENPFGIPDIEIEEEIRRYVSDSVYNAYSAAVWDTERDTVGVAKLLRKHDSAAYDDFTATPRERLSESALGITVH
jgi:hypothetical protein